MAKKDLVGGINSLLNGNPKAGQPETQPTKPQPVTDEIRATFIVPEDLVNKLKAVAYWDRRLLKDVTTEALQQWVRQYEKVNGDIKPIPGK